jgi:hypothetical protein
MEHKTSQDLFRDWAERRRQRALVFAVIFDLLAAILLMAFFGLFSR